MILFCLHEQNTFQVGFTASKKVGNAVMRNRLKRRMRALFYENSTFLQEGRYILVAKKDLNDIKYNDLNNSFKKALKKIGSLAS